MSNCDHYKCVRDGYCKTCCTCGSDLNESTESDVYADLRAATMEVLRLRTALEKIANEDFRGNRPWSAVIAYKALRGEE